MTSLIIALWRRNRELRRQLRTAAERDRQCEEHLTILRREIERLNGELAGVAQHINQSDSRAAAEHWRAFKWGENYKIMELDLAATRTERDLAYERARKLSARVQKLEDELGKVAR
ncbi:MAG TPA: hypothetical protein VLZ12_11820 [Verrucomicrobiae bacterium]|nr:hypothetical protein [Verrucomicrobiae bacterium]